MSICSVNNRIRLVAVRVRHAADSRLCQQRGRRRVDVSRPGRRRPPGRRASLRRTSVAEVQPRWQSPSSRPSRRHPTGAIPGTFTNTSASIIASSLVRRPDTLRSVSSSCATRALRSSLSSGRATSCSGFFSSACRAALAGAGGVRRAACCARFAFRAITFSCPRLAADSARKFSVPQSDESRWGRQPSLASGELRLASHCKRSEKLLTEIAAGNPFPSYYTKLASQGRRLLRGSLLAREGPVSYKPKRFIYVLRSGKDHRSYVGVTSDVGERLATHNSGGSLYTAPYRPWRLVVSLEFPAEDTALRFEHYLKSGSGRAFAARHFL